MIIQGIALKIFNTLQPIMNEFYTTREIAEIFKVSYITAWRWCKYGKVPAFQIGNEWRVKVTDMEDLINSKISRISDQ